MKKFSMLGYDCVRARIYFQVFIENGLIPSKVLLLKPPRNLDRHVDRHALRFVEQGGGKIGRSLKAELAKYVDLDVEYLRRSVISDDAVWEWVDGCVDSLVVFCGIDGVILPKSLLETGKTFLHAHGGYLPNYRGSTCFYYSLLSDQRLGVSVIEMNDVIDGGRVLQRRWYQPPSDRQSIDFFYDSYTRALSLVEFLKNPDHCPATAVNFAEDNDHLGDNYYVIHPLLKHLAILS